MTDANDLLTVLRLSVSRAISGESRVAVAYSGGLDSSLVASLAKEFAVVQCYTCGFSASFDSRNAKAFAEKEGLSVELITPTRSELLSLVAEAALIMDTTDPVRIAYTVPLLCVLDHSKETRILAGNGADELFGGYAKYGGSSDPRGMMSRDLEKALFEGNLLSSAARGLGKELGLPFASEELRAFAARTDLDKKIGGGGRKIILRQVAELLGLPSHSRPKKAAQYSSGVMKEMRRESEQQGLRLSDWTSRIASCAPGQEPIAKAIKK